MQRAALDLERLFDHLSTTGERVPRCDVVYTIRYLWLFVTPRRDNARVLKGPGVEADSLSRFQSQIGGENAHECASNGKMRFPSVHCPPYNPLTNRVLGTYPLHLRRTWRIEDNPHLKKDSL